MLVWNSLKTARCQYCSPETAPLVTTPGVTSSEDFRSATRSLIISHFKTLLQPFCSWCLLFLSLLFYICPTFFEPYHKGTKFSSFHSQAFILCLLPRPRNVEITATFWPHGTATFWPRATAASSAHETAAYGPHEAAASCLALHMTLTTGTAEFFCQDLYSLL